MEKRSHEEIVAKLHEYVDKMRESHAIFIITFIEGLFTF